MAAENILNKWLLQTDETILNKGLYFLIEEAMKEYAKLKCQELLKIVAEKAKIKRNHYLNNQQLLSQAEEKTFNPYEYSYFISKDSILNAVDLENFCS